MKYRLNLFQAFYIAIIFLFKEKSFQYLIRFNSSSANLHKIGYQICKVFLDVFWSEIYHFTSKLNATIMDEKRKIYIIYFGSHIVGDLLKCKAIGIHRLTWFPIAWFHLARIFEHENYYILVIPRLTWSKTVLGEGLLKAKVGFP